MLPLLALTAQAVEPYPLTDPELLAMQWMQTEALYRAVKASGKTRARYARTAVAAWLQQTDGQLTPGQIAAERAIEREGAGSGLAIERRYAPADTRQRALATGAAMARLLDDLKPGWRDDERPMDVLLDEATRGQKTITVYDDIQHAREAAQALREELATESTNYIVRPGYTVTVLAPLDAMGADPFAAIPLDDGSILFRDDVRFEGPSGTLTVKGHGAWVAPDEIRVSGLVLDDLSLGHEGDEVVVKGPGIELRLRGAVYTGQSAGMIVDVVPSASVEADPAVFALFALATAAGFDAVPRPRIPGISYEAKLRVRVREAGAACTADLDAFRALAATDDARYDGMLAQTVLLGGPPTFAPDRDAAGMGLAEQRDGRFASLSGLLLSYWRCANLEAIWADEQQTWVDASQLAMSRAANDLSRARASEPARWPQVRIVANPLDVPGRSRSVSHDSEVTVFLGPQPKEGPDPVVVVHEALHHLIDPEVRGRPCPALDGAWEAVNTRPKVMELGPTPDAWLAESVVRARTVEEGLFPKDVVDAQLKLWTEEGFTLVPAIVGALDRVSADVWLNEQCGEP
ncbi:MAG: hypothetical protein H6738_18515 [Alphaproteobacteria bacterium]|nr:hypothetical protein [Alphaproteobacteria bacterium]